MLKKLYTSIGYLLIIATLGFAIYYYILNPNSSLTANTDYSGLSTAALFAAKLPNENGVIQDLNQYKGKIIVLNFWATWCPPCREEMPELAALYKKYRNKNVVVIGIAAEELTPMREFALSSPVNYPILAGDMQAMGLAETLGNAQSALPYTVIIQADGLVKNIYLGRISIPTIEKDLNTILKPKQN